MKRNHLDKETLDIISSRPERLYVKPQPGEICPRWPKRPGNTRPISGPESVPFNNYYVRRLYHEDLVLCDKQEVIKAQEESAKKLPKITEALKKKPDLVLNAPNEDREAARRAVKNKKNK